MLWLKFGLFLVALFGAIWLVKWVLRKIFNIEKETTNWFSNNHVNHLHKKMDWGIRIATMIAMFVVLYLFFYKEYPFALYLIIWVAFMFIDSSVKAFFQWKYTDNPKQWILTMSEITILVIAALVATIQLDLINLRL
ncbi:hypothetical protein BBH88_04615 [Planococcus antarcticus DSM 14505]|uniref:DUF4181 domain-containing protein n=3 Tax=Planococcus antarcticus DSM 14505 TaxID=1185653 RepID=A0ABM6D340_9BACL|nr:DUF4181 domain-containing protein [Planococcus antarcticus]ANU09628.1 hypothetical protein BBH88_04615 [Planococcus antarcticus DSM 14505]